ncbi:MAG TPA: hypothetical protein VMU48_06715 [Terracidiphilus sp.]|nr:hypothetical protein [Terracidiphilus sp.]
MIALDVQDRKIELEQHLQLLRSLACELERAMKAVAQNSLPELEDSIANQQVLSARLSKLANGLSRDFRETTAPSLAHLDRDLMRQIGVASSTLQKLNQRYSALIQHSSRSVELMVSLFSSFKGQFQEGSAPRLKHQTWSCQI